MAGRPVRARVTLAMAGDPPADGPARLAGFLAARFGGRPLDAVVGVPTVANLARYVADWAEKVWPGLASVTWAEPGTTRETYVPRPRVTGEGP